MGSRALETLSLSEAELDRDALVHANFRIHYVGKVLRQRWRKGFNIARCTLLQGLDRVSTLWLARRRGLTCYRLNWPRSFSLLRRHLPEAPVDHCGCQELAALHLVMNTIIS